VQQQAVIMRFRPATAVLLLALLPASGLRAQDAQPAAPADTAGAFLDAGARVLLNRARDARLSTDRSLRSYTALIRGRVGGGMRMPLKDRTLVRHETAARVRWSRDAETVVQVHAGRAQSPAGVEAAGTGGFGISNVFDPTQDRLYFGLLRDTARSGDDFWIEHPLGERAELHYRYQSGDTTTIRLQDGTVLRVIELRVIPRRNEPHIVRGVLSIDATSGALVQAAFRLARKASILRDLADIDDEDARTASKVPLINPMEFDISLMTVEYSLWDLKHWLPRSMRFEGMVRLGVMQFPGAAEMSYQMLEVLTDADAPNETEEEAAARTVAEWRDEGDYRLVDTRRDRGRKYRILTPRDTMVLIESPHLPPPIWQDAPGFIRADELKRIADRLATVAGPSRPDVPVTFGWGLGTPGMTRYNRVEALSIGAQVTAPLPHVTVIGTARLGLGDLHPNAAVELHRETVRRSLTLRGYHELATADPGSRAFGAGNSVSAALFGRDEGEYYRATGAALTLAPPPLSRQSWQLRGYVELQDAVERTTHIAVPRLWGDSVFRPNIVADEATQYGALLRFRPWWGTDPLRAQFGVDIMAQAELGDFQHARARATLRSAVPLFAGLRLGLEAGAGTSEGDVPVQRLFYVGGASTLRGYEPGSLAGTSMARGRLELARTVRWANLAVFSDWAWAGERTDIRPDDYRWAAGAGVSVLDGIVRLDLARALRASRAWRFELHVDAIL
jgi:hypothetical protein